jgi:predicted GIY-YIG superfamily endonuclease
MGTLVFESELKTTANKELFINAMKSGDYASLLNADTSLSAHPGVYALFNSESNMMYIGGSTNVKHRVSKHLSLLRTAKHRCAAMTFDYLQNQDVFFAFCIEEMNPKMLGDKNKRLFIHEAKMMMLVPKNMLYNNVVPYLSDEDGEFSTDTVCSISVAEMCSNIDMSADAIRANGLSFSDELPIDEAIEFVRKRTVANGRWTPEKAFKAQAYLSELELINSESNLQIQWEWRTEEEKNPIRDQVKTLYNKLNPQPEEEIGPETAPEITVVEPQIEPIPQNKTEACKDLPGAKEPPASLKNWFQVAASVVRSASIKKPMLWGVMLAPAVASFQNVLRVTSDITNEQTPALLLTIAFVCAPFVFVYVGLKSRVIMAITIVLIALEAFCNTVRIYGGLTGFGHRGNPTRFLGIVCELFNTGTYETATFLAAIFSLLAAAVMYAAYSQVRK